MARRPKHPGHKAKPMSQRLKLWGFSCSSSELTVSYIMRRQRRLFKRLLMNFLNFFNIANVLNYSVLTNIGLPLKFLYTFITDSSINNFKCSGKKFIKVTEQVSFFPLVIKITSHAFSQHNHHYSLGPPVKARTPVLEEFWQY